MLGSTTPRGRSRRACAAGASVCFATSAQERGLPYDACGKVVVAIDEREVEPLRRLEERATANGVPGLRWLEASELAEVEPYVTGVAGLHSPETAIADFAAVARAYATDVTASGGQIRTGVAVARRTAERTKSAGPPGRRHHDRRRQGDRVRWPSSGSAGDSLGRAGRATDRPVPRRVLAAAARPLASCPRSYLSASPILHCRFSAFT